MEPSHMQPPPFPAPPSPASTPGSKPVDWGQFLNDVSVFLRAATYALVEAAKKGASPLAQPPAAKPAPPALTPEQVAAGFKSPGEATPVGGSKDPRAADWVS